MDGPPPDQEALLKYLRRMAFPLTFGSILLFFSVGYVRRHYFIHDGQASFVRLSFVFHRVRGRVEIQLFLGCIYRCSTMLTV